MVQLLGMEALTSQRCNRYMQMAAVVPGPK
jgi:hypothetical protein